LIPRISARSSPVIIAPSPKSSPARHCEVIEKLYHKALGITREQEAKLWNCAPRRASLAAPRSGPARRGPRPPRTGLWLVHRRFRHTRSQRSQGTPRRAGVTKFCALLKASRRIGPG
jgi:hypothetical protein